MDVVARQGQAQQGSIEVHSLSGRHFRIHVKFGRLETMGQMGGQTKAEEGKNGGKKSIFGSGSSRDLLRRRMEVVSRVVDQWRIAEV